MATLDRLHFPRRTLRTPPLCSFAFVFRCGVLLLFAVAAVTPPVAAQTDSVTPRPYASINRDAVSYRGPGRAPASDLSGDVVTIGILLPLQGRREAEGQTLLQAAQLALEEEHAAGPLPDGRRLALAVRDESERWGQASSEMVRLITQQQAVALITSSEGNIAHQAEQIANKVGVPVLTLSSDATTTQINVPWIFRLGASDTDQARAFATHIYQQQAFRKVLMITEMDHDGRVGSEEFQKAAVHLHAPPPDRLEIVPSTPGTESLAAQVKVTSPQAIVLWTSPQVAAKLLPLIRPTAPFVPIYLCRKAAQFAAESGDETSGMLPLSENESAAGAWVVASRSSALGIARREFVQRYLARTGVQPGLAAAQTYDAVHIIAAALRSVGPNRARLRDLFAVGTRFQGASGAISFDAAGNALGDVVLVWSQTANSTPTSF